MTHAPNELDTKNWRFCSLVMPLVKAFYSMIGWATRLRVVGTSCVNHLVKQPFITQRGLGGCWKKDKWRSVGQHLWWTRFKRCSVITNWVNNPSISGLKFRAHSYRIEKDRYPKIWWFWSFLICKVWSGKLRSQLTVSNKSASRLLRGRSRTVLAKHPIICNFSNFHERSTMQRAVMKAIKNTLSLGWTK